MRVLPVGGRPFRLVLAVLLAGGILSVHSQSQLQVGYALVTADAGTSLPVGTALFSYTNASGILVSQAGVGAVEPAASGRIFVDEAGTQTGIAIVNPSPQRAIVNLILRDAAGRNVDRRDQTLEAREHLARYVRQLFPGVAPGFAGSLTFQSDVKVAAITLRESRNGRGEPLYTTLPVVVPGQANTSSVVFPHVAAGEGYRTQLVLINSSDQTVRGRIRFTSSDGTDLALRLDGVTSSEFSYEMAPQGTYRAEFDKSGTIGVGYALLTPDSGSGSPSGAAVFRYVRDNSLVTEAGVAATNETTLARIFVDNAGASTGLAIANPSNQAALVTFSLLDRYGTLLETATRPIPAKTHMARFAHELFPGLNNSFTGLMEISSTQPASLVTLRLTVNSRGEQVLTTLPVADMIRPPSATSMTFPHAVNAEGFSTRLILINTATGRAATGKLSFYESNGLGMVTFLGGKPGSEFAYQVAGGGGKQLLPWNSAKAASIELIDAFSNRATREVVVNEGNKLRAITRVLDSSGSVRDDFDLSYASLSPEIAAIDPATGNIEAKRAGFSTLTIESGGVVATGTITVVKVDAGVAGFEITGIVQDLSRRLYLANTSGHTILRTESILQPPQLYAGVAQTAGLKNDVRERSWFRSPAFLAFDQSNGSLYVADSSNHVIRKVSPGASGAVETLAGTGEEGIKDGSLREATFRNPQGLQLDRRGNLWVVDSGNHTVRRIQLSTGIVETVAGRAGSSGWVDGIKDQARFNSPKGIALETESLAQQLDRDRRGDPPPPVSLLVADAGNGVIRRVFESGEVQTIGSGGQSAVSFSRISRSLAAPSAASAPLLFDSPEGIAVDSSRNVFVTEPKAGRITTILPNGEVAAAAQASTFKGPKGLTITQTGRVVVAESNVSAREIAFGGPQITSVAPDHVSDRGGAIVTIKGKNFAPDTRIAIAGKLIVDAKIADTETISATVPVLPSGNGTVTVENRGGIGQAALLVDAVPLSQLSPGQITTVAGGTTYFGDGGAATAASLSDPDDIAVDAFGNLLIADTYNHRIRKVHAATGVITTIAGTGIQGFSGDGGPAILAQFAFPGAIGVDTAGNLFIADTMNHRIRRVDATTGVINTVAGGTRNAYSGDGVQAASSLLNTPLDIALDSAGNILISDSLNFRVRKIDVATGIITTIAGTGVQGFSGDGDLATLAQLARPEGITLDGKGNLFIVDAMNQKIRRVEVATGIITTVAGSGQQGFGGDNGLATAARFPSPHRIAFDTEGFLLIADQYNSRIRKLPLPSGIITTVAGGQTGFPGDNGPATAARFTYPGGVAVDASGNLPIADTFNDRIRRVSAKTGFISTVVGIGQTTSLGDNGPATAAPLNFPEGIAIDAAGNLIIADSRHNKIRKVDAVTGTIATVAGTGQKGFLDGAATSAQLKVPSGVAVDAAGNILIVDSLNDRIRKITVATGIITTVAGSSWGYGGDDGPATEAQFRNPSGIAVDADGNIFVADIYNQRIRRINALTLLITSVAGTGTAGFSGDNVQASGAQLSYPYGVAVDPSRNLLIADGANQRIRRVSAATGIITTVAGSGFAGGPPMDNGPATEGRLAGPRGVLADSAGNLFIADTFNSRVRRVDAVTGIITTIAGTGQHGFSGDGGAAAAAQLQRPAALALGLDGTLFVSDTYNSRIRAIRGPIR